MESKYINCGAHKVVDERIERFYNVLRFLNITDHF